MWTRRVPTSRTKNTYIRRSTTVSTAEQSRASRDRGRDRSFLRRRSPDVGRCDGTIGTPDSGSTSLPSPSRDAFSEVVILREEAIIDAPPLLVQQRLRDRLRVDGLRAESSASFEEEHTLLVRAGVAGVTKTVAMATFPDYPRGDVTVIPIRWVATGRLGELFPTMEANLEVGPTGERQTLLVLVGAYRPPLRGVGRKIDHLLLHTVATATANGFLSRLTAELAACPEPDPATPPNVGIADPAEA